MITVEIPVPPFSRIPLGPLTIHCYALCIIAGILAGSSLASRRWRARGGDDATLERAILFGVVFGIVGARLYHVVTDHQLYFGLGRNPWDALAIWNGGLGIWGGVALGALGAWLAVRGRGVRFWALADAVAPGVLLAQAIGRLGNWFNQELYGRPLQAWWAVRIDPDHRLARYADVATYHPTFAYEMVWNLVGVALLLWLDRRLGLGRGKVFWSYVAYYTAGRTWIEHLRIDTVSIVGGFRLNEYTSWIVFATSIVILLWLCWARPGREERAQDSMVEGGTPQAGDTEVGDDDDH